jgi:hypothetical protein
MGGLPCEPLAGQCTGGRPLDPEDGAERAEALRCDSLGRHTKFAADSFGDCAHRVAEELSLRLVLCAATLTRSSSG